MSAGLIVLILSALLGIQPVTTDLYLPALPALTEGFGAAMSQCCTFAKCRGIKSVRAQSVK